MDETRNDIISKFNEIAGTYDTQRKKLIPCFDDFYRTAVAVAETEAACPSILDIGAGTGLFAALMLEKYPNARFTLIDISDQMLKVAEARFHQCEKVNIIVDDYTAHEFGETYDIIISSLSIHHLRDKEKRTLYKKIYSLLNSGGTFINADQVLGHTPYIDALYKNDWKKKVENSGLSEEELHSAYERTKLDIMAPLHVQLEWMAEAGFSDVDCIYKYFNFAVLFGRKRP